MKHEQSEAAFLAAIKERLEKSTEELDELTLARLGAARRRAVEAGSNKRLWWVGDLLAAGVTGQRNIWIALTLVVAIALVWLALVNPIGQGFNPTPLMEDLEILGAPEALEFYRDMDFYLWASGDPVSG
ncbi:MAG: hypothetical protein KZQ88_00145 [Candidatus Thiodiazotropha sp. (ex Dulcina madagascariensis)]|nr:hypothetical protein [Candidatus Thiodiazotropha sp. (ex Dulcina madagascariensis)]MCU7929072.1 hypothetical protein [Candidatus Thiodiazotropha sp. (ex Dulcina madagascariensis)]